MRIWRSDFQSGTDVKYGLRQGTDIGPYLREPYLCGYKATIEKFSLGTPLDQQTSMLSLKLFVAVLSLSAVPPLLASETPTTTTTATTTTVSDYSPCHTTPVIGWTPVPYNGQCGGTGYTGQSICACPWTLDHRIWFDYKSHNTGTIGAPTRTPPT